MFVNNDDDNGNGIGDDVDNEMLASADNEVDAITVAVDACGDLAQCGGTTSIDGFPLMPGVGVFDPSRGFSYPTMGGTTGSSPTFYSLGATSATIPIFASLPTGACGVQISLAGGCICDGCPGDGDDDLDDHFYSDVCNNSAEPIIAVKVDTLLWKESDASNAPLGVCSNNGGTRIFPGKTSPNDPDAAVRRDIDLVATIAPPIAGVTVYFRVFDVDDPFDQIHGPDAVNNPGLASVIADVNLIDNDLVGCVGSTCDNRGTTTGLGDSSAVTDANGEARITITVSMQPGDNYRAAASVISEAVQTQIGQTDADALSATQVTNTDGTQYWKANGGFTGYQVPTVWSPMLTVWRKLHVEVDSMTTEPETVVDRSPDWQQVFISGANPDSTTGTTTLALSQPLSANQAHQYEGGTIVIPENQFWFSVIDHTDTTVQIDHQVILPEMSYIVGKTAILKDDEPDSGLFQDYFSVTPFIRTAYAAAYLQPVELGDTFNPHKTIGFNLYTSKLELSTGLGWNNTFDQPSQIAFWVSRVVAGYQMSGWTSNSLDNDPDVWLDNSVIDGLQHSPIPDYTEADQSGTTVASGEWDSIVFRGTIDDLVHWPDFLSYVIAHEIGHSAGNQGSEGEHHAEGGLMTGGDIALKESNRSFTGTTIERFRRQVRW